MGTDKPVDRNPAQTALEHHAKRLAVQYAIARAFAEGESLDDVSGLLLSTIVEALEWQSASIWVLDRDGANLRCAAIYPTEGALQRWAEHSRALRLPIGAGLPGRVWKSGEGHWISDTDKDTNFLRAPVAREVGLRHGFAFPIWVRGVLAAVVEMFAAEVRELDQEEADFLQATGHQLGSFIERIDARGAVIRSEARKTGILQAAVDAIVAADSEGRIVEFNPAAERLFGRRREEVIGRRIVDVLVPEDLRDQHQNGLDRYLATGDARIMGKRVRTRALRADGSMIPVELTVTEVRLGDRPTFTAFIRDITGEQEAEIARDRFLEILSHELRTPVTAIYGGAKLATRETIDAEHQRELLADIGTEADRLYRLVEDLIVLARAERGSAPIQVEPVSLDHLVERVIAAVEQRWSTVEYRVEMHGPSQPVEGDETYVEQLLRNLLTNAAKYAEAGRVVEVVIEHGPGESSVRVLDRGPGIDPDEVERLFEIDYRSPRTHGLATGSGIGLFVSRWLVESMGGRIWARPRGGGGSEFGFSLRSADATLEDVPVQEPETALQVPELRPAFLTLEGPLPKSR